MGASMAGRLRAAVLAALALVSPLHEARAQSGVANAAPVLKDFRGLSELRSLFERDRDKIRIVLLLSPT
jgi:hypothetical protein